MLIEKITIKSELPTELGHILFIHGMWHGAWCWTDMMQYLSTKGYSSTSISLRGHAGSDGATYGATIQDYLDDLHSVVNSFKNPPILVGHSMGGFLVQKYIEKYSHPAAVLLASVPPSGAIPEFLRTLFIRPITTFKVLFMRSMNPFIRNIKEARKSLFSLDSSDDFVKKFWFKLCDESFFAFMNMLLFNLPDKAKIKLMGTPIIVIGGEKDNLITANRVISTAKHYGVTPIIIKNTAHNLMLEKNWKETADAMILKIKEI